MFLWSWAVSWLELYSPPRVTWLPQRSWDLSNQSETSSPSSSSLLSVRSNKMKTDLSFIFMLHFCTICVETLLNHLVCLWDVAGLHVFPTFVLYELTILLVLTLTLVIMKVPHFSLFCSFTSSCVHFCHTLSFSSFTSSQFVMAVVVLSAILPPGSRHIRWVVSAGLAQVSEFSFVLGSRARRAGIISREVSGDFCKLQRRPQLPVDAPVLFYPGIINVFYYG